jgi:SRSO17 transposase
MIHGWSALGGPINGRGLASRSRSLACAVCRGATAHDAGPDVPSLYRGFDWSGRPQERSTNGGARQRVGYDQLHHFVAAGVWDSAPLEAALLKEADRLVGDDAGFLVIDDTALPKKGRHSIGVAPQYASSLGKTANCQSLVSLTLASREVPVMVGLRLFLPESWTGDPERMARAGVPKDRQAALTKPEIAIEEIDRVIASGVRFGCVLADSGYGSSGPFRQALSKRGLLWAVGLSRRQNVYPADVGLIFPIAKAGKPRKYHIPDQPPVSAEALLAEGKWQKVS